VEAHSWKKLFLSNLVYCKTNSTSVNDAFGRQARPFAWDTAVSPSSAEQQDCHAQQSITVSRNWNRGVPCRDSVFGEKEEDEKKSRTSNRHSWKPLMVWSNQPPRVIPYRRFAGRSIVHDVLPLSYRNVVFCFTHAGLQTVVGNGISSCK